MIQEEVGARTINRRRPEESSIVLSLRDEVLQLFDGTAPPGGMFVGERRETSAVRFRNQLNDPKYGVYDHEGNWLGQGVPFSLGPTGALVNRCGERLWRVTATVQGDGLSQREPGVSVMLLKRNAFRSQWCEGKGDGTSFQSAAVQTTRKLFSQRGTGELESVSTGFTAALIYPWFNIRRSEFYKNAYRDGSSEELAGRGLYGDYVLLFPKQVLEGRFDNAGECVAPRKNFPLDQVEDVLLRFDYLSVDNLPSLAN
jgi:hypothetical protein